MYLAAAGVGAIGIIDDDSVSIDNLQRQVAYTTADAGTPKAERAAAFCHSLNPHVTAEAMPFRLTAGNALEIVSRYDIVADGSQNFATRYLVNDACYFAKKPMVFAALGQFDGYISTFRPTRRTRPGCRCRATAACFPRRRRPARWRIARKPACWGRWRACWARSRPSRLSRSFWA